MCPTSHWYKLCFFTPQNKTAKANENTLRLLPDKFFPNPQNYICFLKVINSIFIVTPCMLSSYSIITPTTAHI